jgi:hypothetical protein
MPRYLIRTFQKDAQSFFQNARLDTKIRQPTSFENKCQKRYTNLPLPIRWSERYFTLERRSRTHPRCQTSFIQQTKSVSGAK